MPNYAEQDNLAAVDKKEIQQNVDLSLAITRRLLQMIGLWPYATYSKVWRMLLIALVSFVLMFVAVPAALYVAIVVNDLEMRLQLLGPLSFVCMNIFKYFAVLFQEDQLEQCIERITNDWRMVCSQMKNYLMRENVKYAKSFTTVCVTCTYMGVMSYGMFFSFVMDPIIVGNNTYRIFAFPSHFIFFNSFDYFKLIYTIQMMCVFALCTITLSVESIGISCAMHICGQINVIAWIMRSLAADTFDKASFGRIVEKHLRAIAFAKELENFLNGMCFVEFVGSCFNICMLGYYMIMYRNQNLVLFSTYCVLFVSFTFNMFIFCYIGEQLTEKCGNIGSAAYNVDWYRLSAKDAKYLLMTVVSTKRPVVLTAGKFATLSMASFSSILKTSFSYLNMLKTVT